MTTTAFPRQAAPPRYKIRFPDADALRASQAAESPFFDVTVVNHERAFISVSPVKLVGLEAIDPDKQLGRFEREYGAEVVVDTQYSPGGDPRGFPLPVGPEVSDAPSLDDVLEQIRAPEAWELSRGTGAVIAIVDSGVAGARAEFPHVKRRGQWSPIGFDAWSDDYGHGTMCACIATATRAAGGEFDGVAPDASLISCRTTFVDTELTTIYDYLADFAQANGVTVIASNSWGWPYGKPPEPRPFDDFPEALDRALKLGVIALFSAGNNHALAGGSPEGCAPTSIWEYKCRDDVLTVANAQLDGRMWRTSSRGPGQWVGQPGMSSKPDVSAPTPAYGRVLWGAAVASLEKGWGTSGACPQVAGLVALALQHGATDRDAIFDAIRSSAVSLGLDEACQGAGRIDCRAALEQL